MKWVFTSDIAEFPAGGDAWLRRDPVRNTVPMTVLARLRAGLWNDGPMAGWLADGGGEVHGVVLHTPPYPLLLADIPSAAVPALADALADRPLPGVSGPIPQADEFTSAAGRVQAGRMAQRLYLLDALAEHRAAGAPRIAAPGDLDLVVRWMRAFLAEAEPGVGENEDPAEQLRVRIRQGEFVLWEKDGEPVSFAAFSTPIAGMSRIGPVYTPPEVRRNGYGSAATHAATAMAQRSGAERVVLFTDLANPTSNSIYQALGYRPVGDYAVIAFA